MITAIASPTLPTPLPAGVVDSLKPDHLEGPLVRASFGSQGALDFASARSYRGGTSVDYLQRFPISGVPNGGYKGRDEQTMSRVGTDFAGAVRAASALSFAAYLPGGAPVDAASAVLQANDGSYYVTALVRPSAAAYDEPLIMNDASRPLSDLKVLNPAVKAVVDRDEWVDFSKSGAHVTLAAPGSAASAPMAATHRLTATAGTAATSGAPLSTFDRAAVQGDLYYYLMGSLTDSDAMSENQIPRVFRTTNRIAHEQWKLNGMATHVDQVVADLNRLGAKPPSVDAAIRAAQLIRGVAVDRAAVKAVGHQVSQLLSPILANERLPGGVMRGSGY